MPENLFVSVSVPTTQTQILGVTLRELTILRADANSPGVIALSLVPLDDAGNWRHDVAPVVVRKVDDLAGVTPQTRYAASLMHQLVFSAICPDTPTNQAMGVVGMNIWDAAKTILAQEVEPDAE